MALHPDRLFPVEESARGIARRLYAEVATLPIVSPHGHTDPRWYAEDEPFPDPATLFVKPDHYIFRMLYSQGARLEDLGIPRQDGGAVETDPRAIWRTFAKHWYLFRGTPTRLWFDHAMESLFGVTERLRPENADAVYDRIADLLARPDFRPRALYERFNIEVIATTDSALDDLRHHDRIRESGWTGRVVPAYRPDAVVDPDFAGFGANVATFVRAAGFDAVTWPNYIEAHRRKRAFFKERGATSTDHGHPSARTADLGEAAASALVATVAAGGGSF
ncbi:MAG: glucuronate isomerase family protein, partial [Enterovirga sp.]|nr:glucuronate isomerase family protein [Enterovirga sp.]